MEEKLQDFIANKYTLRVGDIITIKVLQNEPVTCRVVHNEQELVPYNLVGDDGKVVDFGGDKLEDITFRLKAHKVLSIRSFKVKPRKFSLNN